MGKVKQVIKYDGNNDELFTKVCVDALDADAQLIIPDTHNAILIKDGQMLETLNSGAYPFFDVKSGIFKTKKVGCITVDVIFMSKTAKLKALWGTKYQFSFRDVLTSIAIKMGANGEFEVQIANPRKFYLELVGADKQFTLDSLRERLAGRLLNEIEPAIAKAIRAKGLSYDRLGEYKKEIADSILPILSDMFAKDYGLKMFSFIISRVVIDEQNIEAIEKELQRVKISKEEEDEYRKILARIERFEDRQWEKEKYMMELASSDREKYLAVCKLIGWDSGEIVKGGSRFCPKCGHSFEATDRFCPGCGEKVGEESLVCSKCKAVNKSGAAFCSSCGNKL